MRWIHHRHAQEMAFSVPDAQAIAFRLPGHLTQDRAHLVARATFGYRAAVDRDNDSWVVSRVPYVDDRARARLEKQRRKEQQRFARRTSPRNGRPIVLRGGL